MQKSFFMLNAMSPRPFASSATRMQRADKVKCVAAAHIILSSQETADAPPLLILALCR
jgi:hypothetical protein